MKLLEAYANNVGVYLPKSGVKPYELYFPVPEKYITFHPCSEIGSKNYDFFQETLNWMTKTLREKGFEILQIGKTEDPLFLGVQDLRGKTTFSQSNYIIKNSSLHLGVDSTWVHTAGLFNTPCVSLYETRLGQAPSPYYSNSNSIYIESENINFIKPEEIVKNVFDILKIKKEIPIETIHIGKFFNKKAVDLVPDHIVSQLITSDITITLRADLFFDLDAIESNLDQRNCNIITKKSIPEKYLEKYKSRITNVLYEKNSNVDIDFVKNLQKFNIKYSVITKNKGKKMQKLKLKLFDYNPPMYIKSFDKNSIRNHSKIELGKTMFKTNRPLLSSSGAYLSDWHWQNKIAQKSLLDNISVLKKNMDKLFYKNLNHYFIFNSK